MLEDTLLAFSLPSVRRKKVTAAFDGGRMTSDGGVMLLAAVETSLGIAAGLAPLITDLRMQEPAVDAGPCGRHRRTSSVAALEQKS